MSYDSETPSPLPAELWRAAGRTDDLAEAVAHMTALLARHFPLRGLLVRHYDPDAGTLTTRAAGRAGGGALPVEATHTACSPADLDALARRAGGSVAELPRGERLSAAVLPAGVHGRASAGVLTGRDGAPLGVLVVLPDGPLAGNARDALALSLEPFAAALAHHLRVRELERLREAAEADRSALLARLGRRELVEEIIGEEGSLRGVMTRVDQVAPTDAPVLILGETGTGKEVVARAVHARSARADGPIVRVNCGAIPPELIDSELFGHEKGAFTGALAARKGWFERADGGTLFLDEIGDLPPAAQVRLLRILQDGTYERVGGEETRRADVRLLAATHRDVEALVAEGRFREDLWYRISVFPLYLPPLRARPADLDALAQHFARAAGVRLGPGPLEVSEPDLALLRAYPWPGNVRELAGVIERAAILGGGHRLDVRGAMGTKLHVMRERLAAPQPASFYGADSPTEAPHPTLDAAMRRHIETALRRCRGRVEGPAGAGALLGVNPHTLRGKMRRLGVDPAAFRP